MEHLYEKLQRYSKSDMYGFHMPGHKRIPFLSSCYEIDITEIDGFDDLHHPEGLLREFEEYMSRIYHSRASYMMVNGSTGGILAAISAVTQLGGELAAARSCHKSVYNAAYLRNLKVHYIYPQTDADWGLFSTVSPMDVEKCLINHPHCKAVMIVSPTYEGVVSDVKKIAEVVHAHGAVLIVDEAHGAHFSFLDGFPQSAAECGADIVIQSVHKTLPSLTQTAVLHVCGSKELQKNVERYLGIYQTSSPSYVFLSSIEECIFWMEQNRNIVGKVYLENLLQFRKRIEKLKRIQLYQYDDSDAETSRWYDRGKLVLRVHGMENSGQWLYRTLLKQYHLQLEMCQPGYCIAMTSVLDDASSFDRLARALEEIDAGLPEQREIDEKQKEIDERKKDIDEQLAEQKNTYEKIEGNEIGEFLQACRSVSVYTAYEAAHREAHPVLLEQCTGEISAETAYVYPPGIPLIVQGEVFTDACVQALCKYRDLGFEIRGIQDSQAKEILVLCTGETETAASEFSRPASV